VLLSFSSSLSLDTHDRNCFKGFATFLPKYSTFQGFATFLPMALSMAAFVRSTAVLMVAVLFLATQMEGQGVFANRLTEGFAPAPAPVEQVAGLAAGVLLPSIAGPILMIVLSFLALRQM
jgi:hypothetical protein